MIFHKDYLANSIATTSQQKHIGDARLAANNQEKLFGVNQGLIPQDVYQEFDRAAETIMRSDNGDVILNDILPMSKSVSIGKIVHKYRQVSDAGRAQTSMSGQNGVKMDQTESKYAGTIIPIQDIGFSRDFREVEAGSSEGYDALIDDNRESMVTFRNHIVTDFMSGSRDSNGNIIVVDGQSWGGMRNDATVEQVDLGAGGENFDFTDTTKTYTQIETAFKSLRDILWIDNNCAKDSTYYVSREIASNMERNSSESFDSQKILNRLAGLLGVAAIKASSELVGNEIMAFPLDSMSVRPIVGMGVNTVAMPRPVYNSAHQFVIWSAVGFQVRNDYNAQTCAMFAQG